ncbi:MAG TPA: transposase [Steroidobacteraceae bacterium]|nr:transposase [Steroidobacteraceae bacterium]
MPRQRRVHLPGGLYHAILRGNHHRAIFDDGDDYLSFEGFVSDAMERYGASLFAYCWMTNHVHLAVRIAEAPLGAVMSVIASRYARAKQRALATTGHLFERRYRARLIDADRYLLALVRYIHLNPVRARMVAGPGDYRWSSHHAYLGAPCPVWLHIEPVLGALGPSVDAARAAYRRFMAAAPPVTERTELSPVAPSSRKNRSKRDPRAVHAPVPGRTRSPRTLDDIASEVARAHDITTDDLRSARRSRPLVRARVEVARRALLEGVANLSQIARYLNRSPSTVSDLLYGHDRAAATATEKP